MPAKRIIFDFDGTLAKHGESGYQLYDGIAELICKLYASGYQLFIWTGAGRKTVNKILALHNLENHFLGYKCVTDPFPKPNLEGLIDFVNEFGHSDFKDWIFIGDGEIELLAAVKLEATAIYAGWEKKNLPSFLVPLQQVKVATFPLGCLDFVN